MFNGFNLTAEDLLAGQDPEGLVRCFFKHSDRVQIRSIRVDGLEYSGGCLVAPLIDPETGCTPEEMGETLVRGPIKIEPVRPITSEWGHLNQEVDGEVALIWNTSTKMATIRRRRFRSVRSTTRRTAGDS